MFIIVLLCIVVIRLLYVYMFTPVGKNGFADYCEGKLKIKSFVENGRDML